MWGLGYKKNECRRIDTFELWCWRRLLRVPWTARRSNQSILKGISPRVFIGRTDAEAETPGHLMGRADLFERMKTGGDGGNRGWDGWMASLTQWTWVWVNSRSWRWTARLGVLQSVGFQRVGHNWATELNWTEGICLNGKVLFHYFSSFSLMNSKCVEGNIKFGWSNYAVNKITCDSGIIISLFFYLCRLHSLLGWSSILTF